MTAEPSLNLLLEWENEVARWRRRTMLLISIFLHILLVLTVVLAPDIFRRGAEMMGITVQPPRKLQTTYLFIPPDLLKRLHQPPPNTNMLSDKNRRAQGRSPVVNPNGLKMPYSRGNSPVPELKAGGPKPTPPAPPAPAPSPAPPAAAQSAAPAAGEKSAEAKASPPPKKPDDHPQLLDVPTPPAGGEISALRLPLSPGEQIRQSAAAAARGRASGVGAGGDAPGQFRNINPNFSTEGPLILSDTRGVDFGPYLARVVSAVRRNWYAVIPESARLGEKGRVGVVFEILKDGSVPQLRLVSSSGAEPLDRAALSGIRASVPFDPLPPEFTGNHLVLQFIFLYNLGYGSP